MTSSDVIAAESGRSCGECTACCEGWLSDDSLDMYAGKSCAHLQDACCTIYEDRPQNPCRIFVCGWLKEPEEYPEEFRPDRSGAIILWDRHWSSWHVLRAVPVGEKVPAETLEWLRLYAKERGMPLQFVQRTVRDDKFVDAQIFAYGSVEFAEAVRSAKEINEADVWQMIPAENVSS